MKIRKVANLDEIFQYQALTERWLGICYPVDYLSAADIYIATTENQEIVGGFCIQTQLPFRVLNSIPQKAPTPKNGEAVELTGLWFRPNEFDPAGRIRFWLALCGCFFRHLGKDVFFAYESSQHGLARAYASANPKIVFSGLTCIQPGMTDAAEEIICQAQAYRIALLPLFSPEFYIKRFFSRRTHVPAYTV